jgi:hypothetical protein
MAKGTINTGKRQTGVALLVVLAILAIGMTSLVLAALNSSGTNEITQVRNRDGLVLAEAKQALIGYVVKQAANYSENVPGELPCPESRSDAGTVNEGANPAFCNPTHATNRTVGRLPWRTLGSDKLVDATTEPLWYAVSPNWVPASATLAGQPTLNAGSAGQLTADGVTNVVAIIIAPGRPLNTNPTAPQAAQGCVARNQSRNDRSHVTGGGDPDYRDYLECENASAAIDATFGSAVVNNATNAVINDQMVTITAGEILNAIQGPLSERMQRTVAPLLSEFSDKWVGGGKFLPYAVPFATAQPDLAPPLASSAFCGTAGLTEGLLPIAANTAPCTTGWINTNMTTSDTLTLQGCSAASATAPVICSFRYYKLTFIGQLVFGIAGVGSASASFSATAPRAASTFRTPIAAANVTVTAGAATIGSFALSPKTDGTADLSFTATVNTPNICKTGLVGGLVCDTLGVLLASTNTVTVQYPQLPEATLQGTKLPGAALATSSAAPYSLLSPVANDPPVLSNPLALSDPHYWFIRNEWYRYTYYAVAGSASAAAAGGNLTINGFPAANGNTNDKRFVLALMGPAVTGQTRTAAATLANYVEGANAATTSVPRLFAYQVYANSGNDRVATCPFLIGAATLCD